MLRDSFTYPFDGDSTINPVLITTILFTISILVLPALIVVGYLMRTIESAANGEKKPPEYTGWKNLSRKGLQGVAVFFGYLMIPLLSFAIAALLVSPDISAETAPTLVDLIALGFALFSFVSYLVIQYLLPAALAATAVNNTIKKAFTPRLLFQVLRSFQYFKAYFLGFVILQVLGGTLLLVLIVTTSGVGALLTPVVYAYLYIQLAYLVGNGYQRALEL